MELEDFFEGTPESKTAMLLSRIMKDYKKRQLVLRILDNKIVWINGIYSHEISLSNSTIFIDGYRAQPNQEIKQQDYIELGRFIFSKLPFFYRLRKMLERSY